MKEKTFLMFGCGSDQALQELATKMVIKRYEQSGKIARLFNPKLDLQPDALLFVSRSLFGGFYYVTTLKGKAVVAFKLGNAPM